MTSALKRVDTSSLADDIIVDLSKARARPDALLREAVVCAPEISPAIIDLVEKAASEASLDEDQNWLLFWGVHALAAAKRTELFQPLLRLIRRCTTDDLDQLLGDAKTETLAKIFISVFDGDAATLIEACADRNVDEFVRSGLIGALARLTFDGAIPREIALAFLDRFDREPLAEPEDQAWQGWQDAIYLLGLEDMRERLHAACREGRFVQPPGELEFCDKHLTAARSLAPGDAQLFDRAHYHSIDDPAEALRWVRDANDEKVGEAFDPAQATALNQDEVKWLTEFLKSEGMPADAMTVEEIDGFFCALAIEPDRAKARKLMPLIFGSSRMPPFKAQDQRTRVGELTVRMWNTILDRLESRVAHRPLLLPCDNPTGYLWANAFFDGLEWLESEWVERIETDEEMVLFVGPIARLGLDDGGEREGLPMTAEDRAECIASLPSSILGLYANVRLAAERLDAEREWSRQPARSNKVGRNAPCPCGSGKKYKRCCGSPEIRALH
jgi:yecA family protein